MEDMKIVFPLYLEVNGKYLLQQDSHFCTDSINP